jgi:hypothetical protein
MNPLKRIRRFATTLAGLAGALVAFGATPAFATRVPPPGGPAGTVQPPPPAHTVVVGGMPGWQIALIAVSRVLSKLRLRDRTQAVIAAYESGLVVPRSDRAR